MVDLDLVDVGSELEITTIKADELASAQFIQYLHRCDKGWAILLRCKKDGDQTGIDIAIDRKAAKMIINYLQTIYEL